jgi:hypothetical protein
MNLELTLGLLTGEARGVDPSFAAEPERDKRAELDALRGSFRSAPGSSIGSSLTPF